MGDSGSKFQALVAEISKEKLDYESNLAKAKDGEAEVASLKEELQKVLAHKDLLS